MEFEKIVDYASRIQREIAASAAGICIMQNNEIIHEWYDGYHHFKKGARKVQADSQFNVYSTRVTYVGLAAAIAIQEGKIGSMDDPLSNYLDEYDQEVLGGTTIRHLITRTTGLRFKGNEVRRVGEPGTVFEGKRPEILAKVVRKATGQSVADIIHERVFKPLGWTRTEWATAGKETLVCDIQTPDGYPSLRLDSSEGDERNLYVSTRELAFWGNLHLTRGFVDGRQVLPAQIFDIATLTHTPATLPAQYPRIGLFWWIQNKAVAECEIGRQIPEGSYQIMGASSCSCLVMPSYNAVAVRMYNSLWKYGQDDFDHIADIQTFGDMAAQLLQTEHTYAKK
jgi:CubicO group peptidase (beta-lactamase class C family)